MIKKKDSEDLTKACHELGCVPKEFFERAHLWVHKQLDRYAAYHALMDFVRYGKIHGFVRTFLDAVLSGRYRPAT